MNSTAPIALFFLLTATSIVTFAATPQGKARYVRTDAPFADDHKVTPPTPFVRPELSTEARKLKRCRGYFKTVGIACRKRAAR